MHLQEKVLKLNMPDVNECEEMVLIDPSVIGQSHLLSNSGFIVLALNRYRRIVVIAEKSHCEALAKYMNPDLCVRITFRPYSTKTQLAKILTQKAFQNQASRYFFINLSYPVFLFANIVSLLKPKATIYWVLHSHLTSIDKPGLIRKYLNKFKFYFMFCLFKNSQFVVLGNRILQNARRRIGENIIDNKVKVVFHPIGIGRLPKDHFPMPKDNIPYKILFLPGWHGLTPRNSDFLERLSKKAQEKGRFEIVIGANRFKAVSGEKTFAIEYSDRLNAISDADLFLHLPIDSYRLQSSGAIIDMLLTGTPVLGLNTDFSQELRGVIGPFGYFFDTEEQIIDFLSSSPIEKGQIQEFRENLKNGFDKIVDLSASQFSRLY